MESSLKPKSKPISHISEVAPNEQAYLKQLEQFYQTYQDRSYQHIFRPDGTLIYGQGIQLVTIKPPVVQLTDHLLTELTDKRINLVNQLQELQMNSIIEPKMGKIQDLTKQIKQIDQQEKDLRRMVDVQSQIKQQHHVEEQITLLKQKSLELLAQRQQLYQDPSQREQWKEVSTQYYQKMNELDQLQQQYKLISEQINQIKDQSKYQISPYKMSTSRSIALKIKPKLIPKSIQVPPSTIKLKHGNSWIKQITVLPTEIQVNQRLFEELWELHPVEYSKIKVFGKTINTPRWQESFGQDYYFSGMLHKARPHDSHPYLPKLLEWVRKDSGEPYMQILINWYQDGNHYIGPHSDDEPQLVTNSPVYSFSFGQPRDFKIISMKKLTPKESMTLTMPDNSLIVMGGEMQKYYKHTVPKRALSTAPKRRINITFRLFKSTQVSTPKPTLIPSTKPKPTLIPSTKPKQKPKLLIKQKPQPKPSTKPKQKPKLLIKKKT